MVKIKNRFGTFKLGERVRYDVFPNWTNIQGIVTRKGVTATGKSRKLFDKQRINPTVLWRDLTDVRKIRK